MTAKKVNTPTVTKSQPPAKDRRTKSSAELAAEQGITGPQDFDTLFGAGADLWEGEADFEAFQAGLRESRRTGG